MALSLQVQLSIQETDYRETDPRIMFTREKWDRLGNPAGEMTDKELEDFISAFIGKAQFTVSATANGYCQVYRSPLYDPVTAARSESLEGTLKWIGKSIISNEARLKIPACSTDISKLVTDWTTEPSTTCDSSV